MEESHIKKEMLLEIRVKINELNRIVDFFQRGKLSEEEFARQLRLGMERLERTLSRAKPGELSNDDWPEMHGAVQKEHGWEI